MERNVTILTEAGLERDSAEGSADVLASLGAVQLQKAEVEPSRRGLTLRVIDQEGRVYYLGYGGLGYLEIVRRDSPDGEILYAPED